MSVDLYAHDEKDDQRDLTKHFPIIDCLKGRLSTNLYPPSATKIKAETTFGQATRSPQGRKASANALAAYKSGHPRHKDERRQLQAAIDDKRMGTSYAHLRPWAAADRRAACSLAHQSVSATGKRLDKPAHVQIEQERSHHRMVQIGISGKLVERPAIVLLQNGDQLLLIPGQIGK